MPLQVYGFHSQLALYFRSIILLIISGQFPYPLPQPAFQTSTTLLMPFLFPSAMKNDLAYYLKRIKKSVQKLLAYVFLYFNIISILSPCSTKVVKTNFSARELHCPSPYFLSGLWLCGGGWGESERNKEFYVLCCPMATEASFELSSSPRSWSVIGKGFHRDLCFSGRRGSFHYCRAILGPTLVMLFVSAM